MIPQNREEKAFTQKPEQDSFKRKKRNYFQSLCSINTKRLFFKHTLVKFFNALNCITEKDKICFLCVFQQPDTISFQKNSITDKIYVLQEYKKAKIHAFINLA